MTIRKITALLLALMLTLCTGALAEVTPSEAAALPSADPLDMQAMIGNKIYDFACTLEEIEEQGINIVEDELKEGYWHAANNGRASFRLLLMGTLGDTEELSVAGVSFVPEGTQVFTMPGGLVVGKHTQADALAAYGTPHVDNDYCDWFQFTRGKIEYRVYYNEETDTIREFQMISRAPLSWGFEFDGQAGVEEKDLPDPSAMDFDEYILDGKLYKGRISLDDLEENGWVLDHGEDLNAELEPQGDMMFVLNTILVCYNGESTLQVFPINRSCDAACKLGECDVMYIGVGETDGASIVLADGLTIGSSYDDVLATFGEAAHVEDHSEDGYIYYEHKAMGSVTYGFSVYDGIVKYIRVKP